MERAAAGEGRSIREKAAGAPPFLRRLRPRVEKLFQGTGRGEKSGEGLRVQFLSGEGVEVKGKRHEMRRGGGGSSVGKWRVCA